MPGTRPSSSRADLAAWPLEQLIDFVVQHHHEYVRAQVPAILRLLDKAVVHHGIVHPQLERLTELFRGEAEDLIEHLDREERVLFPYFRTLAHGRPAGRPLFGPVAAPIAKLKEEHRSCEAEFHMMRALADEYRAPVDASPDLMACYDALEALEWDLRDHVALEEEVLFPAAVRLEEG